MGLKIDETSPVFQVGSGVDPFGPTRAEGFGGGAPSVKTKVCNHEICWKRSQTIERPADW